SRMGLMFNGLLKIPMQFIILFIGVMVFVFFLFHKAPVYYNQQLIDRARELAPAEIGQLEVAYDRLYEEKSAVVGDLVTAIQSKDENSITSVKTDYFVIAGEEKALRDSVKQVIGTAIPGAKTQDQDFIFLNFVINNLPQGIIGLLIAVMFSAAMSSMASELN